MKVETKNGQHVNVIAWFGFGMVRVQFADGTVADIEEDQITAL